MKTFTSFAVSNKAFTNQMLGQQLITRLGQELGQEVFGYYKYHKLTIFSTDSYLNHQIFIHKQQIIEKLIDRAKQTFWVVIKIKDVVGRARSCGSSSENYDYMN